MPLHFGKIFAFIALLTVAAFVLWQLWLAIFSGETFDKPAELLQAEPPATLLAFANLRHGIPSCAIEDHDLWAMMPTGGGAH